MKEERTEVREKRMIVNKKVKERSKQQEARREMLAKIEERIIWRNTSERDNEEQNEGKERKRKARYSKAKASKKNQERPIGKSK